MTVSNVTSTPATAAPATTSRATDGDYLVKSQKTSQTKDADGDYKPISTSNTPAANSTSAVQAAIQSLKKGG